MTTATRLFELEAGDKLVMDREKGDLFLIKPEGERLDLNTYVRDATEGSAQMQMRMFSPLTFMQLCSILAASYGLTGNTVSFEGDVYTCEVMTPH